MTRSADPAAIIEQARALLLTERYGEMLAVTEPGVARFPTEPELRLLHGTALVWARPDDAAHEIATAISLDPSHPWRVKRAATLLFYLGEHEAARDYICHLETLPGADHPLLVEELNPCGPKCA